MEKPSQRKKDTNKDADAALQRILRKVVETDNVADATLLELNDQNEKLKEAQDSHADMEDYLNEDERRISKLGHCFGIGAKKKKSYSQHKAKRVKEEKKLTKTVRKSKKRRIKKRERISMKNGAEHEETLDPTKQEPIKEIDCSFSRSTDDMPFESFIFIDSTDISGDDSEDRKLDDILAHTRQLKEKAVLIGDVVVETTDRVDTMVEKTVLASERLHILDGKAEKLL